MDHRNASSLAAHSVRAVVARLGSFRLVWAGSGIAVATILAVPAMAQLDGSHGGAVAATAMGAMLPQDMSPWSMFMNADIVVKAVMVGLAFASLVTWTVWLAKAFELFAAKRRARSATRKLARADNLAQARAEIESGWTKQGAVAELVQAATRETGRSGDLAAEGIKERLAIALSRIEARAGRIWRGAPGCSRPSAPPRRS